MLRALVTGGNGFIGSALLRAAPAARIQASGLVRGNTDYTPSGVAARVDATQADIVIHAAGSASVAASVADPAADYQNSVALTQLRLEGVRRSGRLPRVVIVSSAAVYGNPQRQPVGEDAVAAPISPYGRHKVQCEALLREYALAHGVPGLALRPFSLFGAGQKRLLVWELFRQHREAAEVVLRGSGDEERDYLHVDDFAALAWRCASTVRETWTELNVASGASICVRELAVKIGGLLGTVRPLRCENRANTGDPTIWRADIGRLGALLGELHLPAFEERLGEVLGEWAR